jgi:hypothetical protein
MSIDDGSQPPTSPQLIEPEKMGKLLRYMMRHGLYVASYMSIYYETLSALHDYSTRDIDDTDFTATFSPTLFSPWLQPLKMTISIRAGKIWMSGKPRFPSPLKRWLKNYSIMPSKTTDVSSKEELLGIIFTSLVMRNFLPLWEAFRRALQPDSLEIFQPPSRPRDRCLPLSRF